MNVTASLGCKILNTKLRRTVTCYYDKNQFIEFLYTICDRGPLIVCCITRCRGKEIVKQDRKKKMEKMRQQKMNSL
jgi:hypothetical protein